MPYYEQKFRFGFAGGLTPMVRNILIVTGSVWIAQLFANSYLLEIFALQPLSIQNYFTIWQLVTYMFLHGSFFHIFFDMFALWMFGCEVERTLGSSKFLQYYFLTGIAGGLTQLFVNWGTPSIILGASGAIYGVLVAFGVFFPHRTVTLLLFFILPIQMKARTLVAIFIGISILLGFKSQLFGAGGGATAHFAHLGGAFAGYLFLRGRYLYSVMLVKIATYQQQKREERERIREESIHQKRKEIDKILDLINEVGYENIPQEDKDFLKQASEFLAKEEEN